MILTCNMDCVVLPEEFIFGNHIFFSSSLFFSLVNTMKCAYQYHDKVYPLYANEIFWIMQYLTLPEVCFHSLPYGNIYNTYFGHYWYRWHYLNQCWLIIRFCGIRMRAISCEILMISICKTSLKYILWITTACLYHKQCTRMKKNYHVTVYSGKSGILFCGVMQEFIAS